MRVNGGQFRKAGGELAGLDLDALAPIISQYETQVDAFLLDTAADYRMGKLLSKIAAVQKDPQASAQQKQAAIDRWKRLYDLNKSTVENIGAVVASTLGEAARQRWLERFDAGCFAWMYPRKKPDREFEWMSRQSLAPEQMQNARQVYDRYSARRKDLNKQAIDLMIRARVKFQTMLYSMMDPTGMNDQVYHGLYQELLKNSGEQATLESSASGALESILTDAQRKSMREFMRGPDPAKRR